MPAQQVTILRRFYHAYSDSIARLASLEVVTGGQDCSLIACTELSTDGNKMNRV